MSHLLMYWIKDRKEDSKNVNIVVCLFHGILNIFILVIKIRLAAETLAMADIAELFLIENLY